MGEWDDEDGGSRGVRYLNVTSWAMAPSLLLLALLCTMCKTAFSLKRTFTLGYL